jgi:hypothetical protein
MQYIVPRKAWYFLLNSSMCRRMQLELLRGTIEAHGRLLSLKW